MKKYVAFCGHRCIARQEIEGVARAVKEIHDSGSRERLSVYDDETSEVIELDLRGSVEDVLARLAHHPILSQRTVRDRAAEQNQQPADAAVKQAGPGRPRLGVVSREVSLLPRHWDWLAKQSGGASAALRRLVDEARKAGMEKDRRAELQQAVHRFLWDMAGDLTGFEEVSRAFYAGDFEKVRTLIAEWPADVRVHAKRLVQRLLPADAAATAG